MLPEFMHFRSVDLRILYAVKDANASENIILFVKAWEIMAGIGTT